MNQCDPHECDGQPEGHHVTAKSPAEPRCGQARSPRRGRSEAEWLDRTADGRTISRRDGRSARDLGARQRTCEAIEARWWKKGRRRRSTAAAVRIRSECALTYMNASSGEKPVSRADCAHDRGCARRSNHAAHSTGSRTRAVPPDERDMHLGRERPPKTRPGTVFGGWQRGSLTPQDASVTAAGSRADFDMGGKQRRPLRYSQVVRCKGH